MSEASGQPVRNRYDFVFFFEVADANPNGDPDAGNLPRIDPETGQGLVTDVCLKRKVRNYVGQARPDQLGYRIFVRERAVLNRQIEEAYEQSNEIKRSLQEWAEYERAKRSKKEKERPRAPEEHPEDIARQWMCEQFFDIRTFGAVMSTGKEKEDEATASKIRRTAGQVRGPVQLGFAKSLHAVVSQEHALTVCAARTDDKPIEDQIGIQGRKSTIPYALYRVHGYVNPNLANGDGGTGFSEADLALFKEAIDRLFEFDASAARPPGSMRPVACIAFRHENRLGNARADELFKRVTCLPRPGIQPLPTQRDADGHPLKAKPDDRPPRSIDDYELAAPPPGPLENVAGVTVEHWVCSG
jgi:CRISPR-associated protein Csd2